jgi:type IV secretion system protein VirB10
VVVHSRNPVIRIALPTIPSANYAYGQQRVLIVWTRLLRPDGSTLSLEGTPGTDPSGYAGLTGSVNNHYLRLLSGVVLGSVIGAVKKPPDSR